MYGTSIVEKVMKIVTDRAIADALGISAEKVKEIELGMIEKSHMKQQIYLLKMQNRNLKKRLEKYEPKATKYRKKPLEVEAVKYENIDQIKRYFPDIETRDDNRASKAISLRTLEDRVELQVGDYVIKGIKGEYYPCKPEIFEESYERV